MTAPTDGPTDGPTSGPARPTLAAVVVNYNYARYVGHAIDSLLAQTRPFDEIVVVDDGSTDESMQVLEAYRARVRVVGQRNSGQLGACRTGLAATRSEYVYFLDADDYARPDLVESVQPAMRRAPVKVQFALESVSEGAAGGAVFPMFPEHYDSDRMRADNRSVGFYTCPPTSGNVYRRQVLAALRLDQLDQRDFIDGPATMAMPYLGEVATVNRPLAVYRMHGANHSHHGAPSAERLTGEIDWFTGRWEQAVALLGMPAPPFAPDDPLYVLERRLMVAALGDGRGVPRWAARVLLRSRGTNLPARRRLMMTGWTLGLLVPAPGLRRSLVRSRLSPLTRSVFAGRLVALLRGRAGRAATRSRRDPSGQVGTAGRPGGSR